MNIFSRVSNNKPGKSVFDLSYEKLFTCDMGKCIPVMADEVVPGDIFSIGNNIVVRFQPLVAPVLHPIDIVVHYYYVPYRLIGKEIGTDFEAFITGGEAGTDATVLPTWDVTNNAVGSLWDYLGFPIGIDALGARPLKFPQIAYNMIWNEFYRDENVQTEVNIQTQEAILDACWEKDYFTSALPWQQRGTAPGFPLSGVLTVIPDTVPITMKSGTGATKAIVGTSGQVNVIANSAWDQSTNLYWVATSMKVDMSGATTFNIADMRLAMAIQKWMERNARSGARYIEWLQAHFGTSPRDDRLDRPEYIGGSKAPMIISEVLQTSKTDVSPQGNMAGHGISVQRNFCANIRVPEYGLIMGIMVIRPKPMYHQGIDRQWLKSTRYDFYHPEFAGLSMQPIKEVELYATAVEAQNNTVFGYQGRYDELRYKKSMICGDMHVDFDHWHLCRNFSARPTLNSAFVTCTPRKDILAAPAEDAFIVRFGNIIKAIRPLPYLSEPGGI